MHHPAAFEGVRPEQLAVRCLRKRHYLRDDVLGAQVAWFNALCVDDFDLPAFREWQSAGAQAEAAAAAAGEAGEGGGTGDLAARATAAAAAAREAAAAAAGQGGQQEKQPEDFYSLQDEFYSGDAGAAKEAPRATER